MRGGIQEVFQFKNFRGRGVLHKSLQKMHQYKSKPTHKVERGLQGLILLEIRKNMLIVEEL